MAVNSGARGEHPPGDAHAAVARGGRPPRSGNSLRRDPQRPLLTALVPFQLDVPKAAGTAQSPSRWRALAAVARLHHTARDARLGIAG
jgi:hypothetical protein